MSVNYNLKKPERRQPPVSRHQILSNNGGKSIPWRGLAGELHWNVEEPALRHHVSDEDTHRTEPATGQTDFDPKPPLD